ncbi:nucleotidyltransferase [Bradyrhizobium sp. 4]|uniref:SMODS domain-containing nucleotidyltransferase n=1 Tax=unclassified Bradyrhizobium TaxID=2631580 RepID=UPI001FF89980|nr:MULTISPECIES: nucleotidyltransferase [unclassified Bradyrhizobium]MCK1402697.1 nucleotidyltransferase [Bradyrhizobium sp. 39]MCK1748292.1 nucleotidyltransferase [Bradyrhizobium sp. 135]UPJ32770.1 nucleotidyltransferase [Bradyrhizobium sp. 4]
MVPAARFTELLADIEPSPTTVSRASGGHNGVRNHLRAQARFKDRYVTSFLSGSYARDTSIRPHSSENGQERPDVDIIVVTNHETSDQPEAVLKELCQALEDGGQGYAVERINKRSVRVETWQAEMDVVPVIKTWNGYMIPDRENDTWKFTNPPVHTQWSLERNTAFDGRFKPLVKLFKWWRRVNWSGRRPKGFVLEVLVGRHAPVDETHYGEAFAQTLANIHAAYGALAIAGGKPFIADPAVPSNDIISKVSLAQWTDFVEKVRVYADIARRAQNASDMEEATWQWRRVFGDRFRRTANVAKASTLASVAAAPAQPGYTFPNAMAAPKTPRGFA